jgi:hypothetical protein
MKQIISSVFLLTLLAAIIFFGCNKQSSNNAGQNPVKKDEVTYVFSNGTGVSPNRSVMEKYYKENANSMGVACAVDASLMNYSVTYSSGQAGYLTLSKIYYNNPTKPTSVNIKLNGVSFALTYTGQVTSNAWGYSLATIPLSSIGVSDICTSPAPVIEFYACGVLVSSDNIALNPISYVCSGASQQPIVLGTGIAGQFSMQVPWLVCNCGL